MKMQNMTHIGVPSQTLQLEYPRQNHLPFSSSTIQNESLIAKLRAKITETVKKKLRLGAKVRQHGAKRIFQQHFSIKEGEQLLKASQCYISTTAGPIFGLLFISTHKISFCSEKPINFPSKTGNFGKIHYKVVIPVGKILKVNESRNVKTPSQKYIEIVTVDNYDFWFVGFLSYRKTLEYLQQSTF